MNGIYVSPGCGARFVAMEGLRGVAVLMIFVCHYDVLIRRNLNVPVTVAFFSAVLGRMGTAGVDLFFLLSGLLIYRLTLRTNVRYAQFVKRRAVRIYPAFLAVFTVYILLSLALPRLTRPVGEGWTFVKTISLNLAFLPGFMDIKPIVAVAWSLSYEWYFYMTVPFVIGLLRLQRWTRTMRVSFILFVGSAYLILSALGPQISALMGVPIYRFHVRLVMFLVGMIAYEVLESSIMISWHLAWERGSMALAVLGLGVLFLMEIAHGPAEVRTIFDPRFEALRCIVLVMVFLPITLWALGRDGLFARLFSIPELRWLGNISYSYYLVHTLAINFVRVGAMRSRIAVRYPLMSWTLLFPITLGLSVMIAVVLFVLVERRFSLRPSASAKPAKSGEICPDGRQVFGMGIHRAGDAVIR